MRLGESDRRRPGVGLKLRLIRMRPTSRLALAILLFQRGLQGFLKGIDGGIGAGEAQQTVTDDPLFVGMLEAVAAEVNESAQATGSLHVQQVAEGKRVKMALGIDEVGLEVAHQIQITMADEHGDEVPAGLPV